MAGRLISKYSAIDFRLSGCLESRSMIFLLVGSAIAWNTSLLDSMVILGKYMLTQI